MTTAIDRSWREKLIDVREPRHLATPLELRSDATSGNLILEGYASTFLAYDVYGGIDGGGWVERLDRNAFDVTLRARPDVQLLVNHEGWPLARTKSGTLELSVDDGGLKVRANLDKSDPDVQRLLPKMKRKDMDEMSFAFRVSAQSWNTDYTERCIREVNLQKGDVSVVNYGANPTTSAQLSEAIDALSSLSNKELVELRKLDGGKLDKALRTLASVRGGTPLTARSKKTSKDEKIDRYSIVRSADGAEILVQIMSDGRVIPVTLGQPMKPLPIAFSTSPTARDWSGATTGSSPLPDGAADPHNYPGYTKDVLDNDRNLSVDHQIDPSGGAAQMIPTADGYDPHTQAFGPVHTYGAENTTMEARDDDEMSLASDDDDEMCDRDDDEMNRDDDEMSLSAGLLTLVKALESTIVDCYQLAEGNKDMQNLLARARRQVRDIQGSPAENTDVSRQLNELRGEFGDPETISVSDGLRALEKAGYADMMHDTVTQRRKDAVDPFPASGDYTYVPPRSGK